MHSEWIDGVILRPMMDAGYTAWRDGERLGIGLLVADTIEVEADDARVRELLHQRLAADARAAGIHLKDCGIRVSLVTLGVSDLARARAFYEALGWRTGAGARRRRRLLRHGRPDRLALVARVARGGLGRGGRRRLGRRDARVQRRARRRRSTR